jgi:hypothetical protein
MASLLYDDFCDDERFGGYDKGDSRIMNRPDKKIKKKTPPQVATPVASPKPLLKKKSSEVKIVVPIAEKTPMVLPKIVEEKVEEKVKDSWEDDD